jgi:pimeloyl-ACP methyl ester carboxylesterase
VGLSEAIQSIANYLVENGLKDIVLLGHSYAGSIISGVADRAPDRIRRLIYWNAFVPNNGESIYDMMPQVLIDVLNASAADRGDGSAMFPFEVWREALINDADLETAQRTYALLNPHPLKTLTDKISLRMNPAAMRMGKSYINCTEDISLPPHYPWHPRLSQKLGLYRLVQVSGSHELCFTDPLKLAQAILNAGRD